ncbi:hypothetical protein [Roseimicrobium sp. ORNL1]|uniref:hypothetical protein n=1 Tax=Roseimicrobium sp. ORNL1 TaxID=2711231 RepID=UPI0013E0FAF0|nr:hypothetical protein [Roseimicrobium sp. ORNL1]QIF04631.1 hypothetical protein G5S37_24915 [Roseimicrobium sp. ORNL1]
MSNGSPWRGNFESSTRPMDEETINPYGSCTLIWLEKKDFCPMAQIPPRTAARMAKDGRIPGTEGRAPGRHDDPWPILLIDKLEKWIQDHLDWKRRLAVEQERKATGAKLTRLPAITQAVDTIEVELGRMAERKVHKRLSGQDIMILEKELRRGRAKLAAYHNVVLKLMEGDEIPTIPDAA